mgnify:CR=1 FL=1
MHYLIHMSSFFYRTAVRGGHISDILSCETLQRKVQSSSLTPVLDSFNLMSTHPRVTGVCTLQTSVPTGDRRRSSSGRM